MDADTWNEAVLGQLEEAHQEIAKLRQRNTRIWDWTRILYHNAKAEIERMQTDLNTVNAWALAVQDNNTKLYEKLAEERKSRIHQLNELEQTMAQALGGFPWYKDDQANFPGATEADGVCVGELVIEDLVGLISRTLTAERAKVYELSQKLVSMAWLRGFDQEDIAPDMNGARAALRFIEGQPWGEVPIQTIKEEGPKE
jgi:hypothetical protein